MSLLEAQSGAVGNDCRAETKEKIPNIPILVLDPRRLVDLLKICTTIVQGQQHLYWLSFTMLIPVFVTKQHLAFNNILALCSLTHAFNFSIIVSLFLSAVPKLSDGFLVENY